METATSSGDEPKKNLFKPPPDTFKLVAPNLASSKFKPAGEREVSLLIPVEPGVRYGEAPPQTLPAAAPDDDKIRAMIEKLLKNEHRLKEAEEENRVLIRTISRLQAENDALKAK